MLREFKQAVAELYPSSSTSSTGTPGSASSRDNAAAAAGSARSGMLSSGSHPGADYRLSRFYMWAQTNDSVFVAVYMPTGDAKKAAIHEIDIRFDDIP